MLAFKSFTTKTSITLIILTLLGGVLHFYNLNWGAPYYFHPDERNVASAISQLQFPSQLNPQFFAYGSLPIYAVFFTGVFTNMFIGNTDIYQISFPQAIVIGRIYSALFATAMVPLLFIVTRMLFPNNLEEKWKNRIGLFVAGLSVFSTGFIQFAHFSTFEMWLTFFTLLLFVTCLQTLKQISVKNVLLLGITFGILVATKISSLALLPLPLIALAVVFKKNPFRKSILSFFVYAILFLCTTSILYVLTNPYVFLDTKAFISSMQYESSVGLNTLPVFYTQAFYDTTPILYQFINIYPFLLNPLLTLLFIPSFLFVLFLGIKKKNVVYLFVIFFYTILFLSQAVLFIKWTRYMLPTLPFVFFIIAIAFAQTLTKHPSKHINHMMTVTAGIILFASSLFSLSYFITAYVYPDTRVTALEYARNRISPNTPVLSEMYDIGITTFNQDLHNITIFNTYDTDAESPVYNQSTWKTALENSDYVILPSQRVLQSRIQNAKRYPNGNTMYSSLFNGNAGFEKIYETPCDIFCKIAYLGDPVYNYEQTATVFDRPTVYIFQKK